MLKEYKSIREIVGPLMLVDGVQGVAYDELVEISGADGTVRRGKVLEVNRDKALVQLFEGAQGIQMSKSKARFLGRSLELAVSEDMLGRIFDGLGNPKDGGAPIIAEKKMDINGQPLNPAARVYSDGNIRNRRIEYACQRSKTSRIFDVGSSACGTCRADSKTGESFEQRQ